MTHGGGRTGLLLIGLAGLLATAAVVAVLRHPTAGPPGPTPHPAPGPTRPAPTTLAGPDRAATTGPRLLFGLGSEADSALTSPLVRHVPVGMLTSWYNGPDDLSWLDRWRTGTVPRAYAAGYALHLVVWTGDTERRLSTSYGRACGRGYPLSARFVDDMRRLADIFAGPADGPPLYVTLFTEFQTFACRDNAWSPDAATTHYYRALQDQYRKAYDAIHRRAANARVSLGWGGWQAGYDDPARGGGRSLFAHFDAVMRMSDFQSFQAMDSSGNVADIRAMVGVLGRYGPVMLAHYKPDNGSPATFAHDLRTVLSAPVLAQLVRGGLFAISFMDSRNLASAPILSFVESAVDRYGRAW